MVTAKHPSTKRGQERDDVSLKAALTYQGKRVSGEVMNISIGGAQVRVKDEFGSEGLLLLDLGQFGSLPCRVAWANKQLYGLEFVGEQTDIGETLMALAAFA
jgi:hypothetical protein